MAVDLVVTGEIDVLLRGARPVARRVIELWGPENVKVVESR